MTNDRLYTILRGFASQGNEIISDESGFFELDRYALDFTFDVKEVKKTGTVGGSQYYPVESTDTHLEIKEVCEWSFNNEDEPIELNEYQINLVSAWLNTQLIGLEVKKSWGCYKRVEKEG